MFAPGFAKLSTSHLCDVLVESPYIYLPREKEPHDFGFSAHGNVTVGNYCAIAKDCLLISHNHRFDIPALRIDFQRQLFPGLELQSDDYVNIGDNVWLGKSVVILPNVSIGDSAIIGADAVVTKDVAAYTVVGGNPARFIRDRFPKDITKKIEA